jgi:hypothetical protein
MDLKNIARHINILNLILASIACALYFYTIAPLFSATLKLTLPPPKEITLGDLPKVADLSVPSYAEFRDVGEKNLFHPDRLIPTEKVLLPEPKPEIILYGTLVSSRFRVAYLEEKRNAAAPDSFNATGRNKNQRTMKIGDNISGYILKSIERDSVTFVKGEDKIFVSLKDRQNRDRTTVQESLSRTPISSTSQGRHFPSPQQLPSNSNHNPSAPFKLVPQRPVR